MLQCQNKAQSTLEYAMLITVVVGSLLYMQNYLKRSMAGRIRKISNQIGDQYSPGQTKIKQISITRVDQIKEHEPKGFNSEKTTEHINGRQERKEIRTLTSLKNEEWPE